MSTDSGFHYDVSSAALRPLMQMFWSAKGWRSPPVPPDPEAMQRAVEAGVMFDQPAMLLHDEWVRSAQDAAAALTCVEVGNAFLASLSSRRLDLRSALGSYVIACVLPTHTFDRRPGHWMCRVCGQYPPAGQDLNVFNFERFKWGGVRRDHAQYIAFDLSQFACAPRLEPTAEDMAIADQLFRTLMTAPDDATAGKISSRLTMIPGNRAERDVLLDILGVCGILASPNHSGYLETFTNEDARPLPYGRGTDRAYPVAWWRGRYGVQIPAIQLLFPNLPGLLGP